jgi:acetate kinase
VIIALNAGSSSLKFAVYTDRAEEPGGGMESIAHGAVTRIGEPSPAAEFTVAGQAPQLEDLAEPGHAAAVGAVFGRLSRELPLAKIRGVGHRVVHGGEVRGHALIDESIESAIERAVELAPIHNPPALDVIRQTRRRLGATLPMAAIFDTGFYADLDPRARHYAIPWELARRHGIQRFGFHGIAHQSMMETAARLLGKSADELTLITLQLGNGCSAALIRKGRAIDTTMGMTPLEGLMMGTRSGTVDPALISFIAEKEDLTASEVTNLLNDESGLLGVSGISSDMRDVMAAAATDPQASLAVAMFTYRIRKQIGGFIAAGGPIDAVVFGGGIGERAADVRRVVCQDLGHIGIQLDDAANQRHAGGSADLSAPPAMVRTLVAEVDELRTIADITRSIVA